MQTDYAKAFRVVRATFGWSQADTARKLGITSSALSLIEAGKRNPSVGVVDKLASVANVPSALVVLLASGEAEIGGENMPSMANALLRLLTSAGDKQPELPLEKAK